MAIICRGIHLLFILTPRTASTAVGEILLRDLAGHYLPDDDILDDKGFITVQRKHSTLKELLKKSLLTEAEKESLRKFTCVRNPFDSLVSLYTKKREKYRPLLADKESWVYRTPGYVKDMEYCRKHSFNSWILRHHYRGSLRRIFGQKSSMYSEFVSGMDAVIRFENLDQELREYFQILDIDYVPQIPQINTTKGRSADYRHYYNRLSRWIVEFAVGHDLKTFGYHF